MSSIERFVSCSESPYYLCCVVCRGSCCTAMLHLVRKKRLSTNSSCLEACKHRQRRERGLSQGWSQRSHTLHTVPLREWVNLTPDIFNKSVISIAEMMTMMCPIICDTGASESCYQGAWWSGEVFWVQARQLCSEQALEETQQPPQERKNQKNSP